MGNSSSSRNVVETETLEERHAEAAKFIETVNEKLEEKVAPLERFVASDAMLIGLVGGGTVVGGGVAEMVSKRCSASLASRVSLFNVGLLWGAVFVGPFFWTTYMMRLRDVAEAGFGTALYQLEEESKDDGKGLEEYPKVIAATKARHDSLRMVNFRNRMALLTSEIPLWND